MSVTFFKNLSDEINFDEFMSNLTVGFQEEMYMFDENGNVPDDLEGEDKEFAEKIHKAGYKDPIGCDMLYYPHFHFDEKIVYQLDKIFGTVCTMFWINRALPGRAILPHVDVDEREDELEEYGELIRYHIHVGKPEPGHIFIQGETVFHMEKQGNCYRWDDHRGIHSGSNTGLSPKFLMSYRGLILDPEHRDLFKDHSYIWNGEQETVRIKLKDGRIL